MMNHPRKRDTQAWGSAKLVQRVLADSLDSWEKNGIETLERLRKEKPSDYLAFIAKVLGRAVELEGRLADADRPTALTVTWVSPAPLQLPQAIEAEWQALPMEVKEKALQESALKEQEDEPEEYVPFKEDLPPVGIKEPIQLESKALSTPSEALVLPDPKVVRAESASKATHASTKRAFERYKSMPPEVVELKRKQADYQKALYYKKKERQKQQRDAEGREYQASKNGG